MNRAEQVAYLSQQSWDEVNLKDFGSPDSELSKCQPELALIERTFPSLLRGGRVLDVGAGSGYFTHALMRAGAKAVGLEPVTELVAYGREHGIDLRCGRFEPEGVPDELLGERFDLICFRECVSCFPDLKVSFNILHRLLAPGGRIYIKMHQAKSYYYSVCDDYTCRYGVYTGCMPTLDSLTYILDQEQFKTAYAGYYSHFSNVVSDLGWAQFGQTLAGRVINRLVRPLINAVGRGDRVVILASSNRLSQG